MNIPSVIALVTGAASGLGRATAQRLLKNGAKVGVVDLPNALEGEGLEKLKASTPEFNDNDKVKEFCNTNFSLTLPMTTITKVKGSNAHPLFKWLADKHNFRPVWNFNKVLLNKDGMFVASFGAFTNPNSRKIKSKILDLLKN